MTDETIQNEAPTCDGCKLQGVYVQIFCLSNGVPTSLVCPVWREHNRLRLKMGEVEFSDGIIKTKPDPLQPGDNLIALCANCHAKFHDKLEAEEATS